MDGWGGEVWREGLLLPVAVHESRRDPWMEMGARDKGARRSGVPGIRPSCEGTGRASPLPGTLRHCTAPGPCAMPSVAAGSQLQPAPLCL